MPLVGEDSLLQETVERVSDPTLFSAPLLICNDEHRFLVAEQLRALGCKPEAIVLEPLARNTAPAVRGGRIDGRARQPAADPALRPLHRRTPRPSAAPSARRPRRRRRDRWSPSASRPRAPETGYGYIRRGEALPDAPGCRKVAAFVEKPDAATAEGYLASGEYLWNGGMFLFRADRFLAELGRLEPAMKAAVEKCRRRRHARSRLHPPRQGRPSPKHRPSPSTMP